MNDRANLYAFVGGASVIALAVLLGRRRSGFPSAGKPSMPSATPKVRGAVQEAIVNEANRQGVNPALALMFAEFESAFNPGVVAARDWPYRGDNWERFVLNNPRLQGNPYLLDRKLWIAYGVFQLLSPFHLPHPMANPRSLLNVDTNVRLGVAKIKRLMAKYGNDPLAVRMAYVCGRPSACEVTEAERIASKMERRAERWNIYLGGDAIARAREMAA